MVVIMSIMGAMPVIMLVMAAEIMPIMADMADGMAAHSRTPWRCGDHVPLRSRLERKRRVCCPAAKSLRVARGLRGYTMSCRKLV